MKQTLTTTQAAHILLADENANWSWKGAYALVEWFEELEECGEESIELCPVSIRCDFSEYKSALECVEDCGYDCDFSECEEAEEQERALRKSGAIADADQLKDGNDGMRERTAETYLRENTCVIEFEGGIIVQSF